MGVVQGRRMVLRVRLVNAVWSGYARIGGWLGCVCGQ